MVLRIPVYPMLVEKLPEQLVKLDQSTQAYIVKHKETKWRIAYNFQITIPELEALNPEIKKGLKEGQEIRIPIVASTTESETIDPAGTVASIITKYSQGRLLSHRKKNRGNPKGIGFPQSKPVCFGITGRDDIEGSR